MSEAKKGPPPHSVVPIQRPEPAFVKCPYCHVDIKTFTRHKAGHLVYVICTSICLFGCCCGCCLIPCCFRSLKDVHHTCPNCGAFLGKYERVLRV